MLRRPHQPTAQIHRDDPRPLVDGSSRAATLTAVTTPAHEQKKLAVAVHDAKAPEFDRDYRLLDQNPYASTFVYGRKKVERLIDDVMSSMPSGGRALDAGCGTGFNIRRLHELGFDVVGVEPSVEMRTRAQANNPGVDIRDGDILSLPFGPEEFDVVLAIEVIRYLVDPAPAVAELARVLRPGGTAIVTAAPRWSLNGYAALNRITSRHSIPSFTRLPQVFLSSKTGAQLMLKGGFKSVEVHGRFLGPFQPLGRVSPRVLRAVLKAWEPVDDRLSDLPYVKDLTNHLVLVGRK